MSQIICPISGEILFKSDLLLGFNLSSLHPIFQAKKQYLLTADIIHKFQRAASWREKKLYYLAVLNTTDLVDFRCSAEPTPYILDATFFDVATLSSWVDYAKYKIRDRIQFPRYVVTPDNRNMSNISVWLSVIYDIKNAFLEVGKQEDFKRELREKDIEIEREFRKVAVLGRVFTPFLAKWALTLAKVEEGVFDKWSKILVTPLVDAWTLQKEDLVEIYDHLQAELPNSHDQVIAVLHQIRILLGKAKEGFTAFNFLDDEGNEIEETTSTITQSKNKGNENSNQIIHEDHQLLSMDDLPPKPERGQFAKPHEYLQAKARWDILFKEASGSGMRGEYEQF